MIAASSVPNLSTFQQESPKKTKKYRIETDSETPYMSDVDYRYIDHTYNMVLYDSYSIIQTS